MTYKGSSYMRGKKSTVYPRSKKTTYNSKFRGALRYKPRYTSVPRPRFAMVGFARDVEKKYQDTVWQYANWTNQTITWTNPGGTTITTGRKFLSTPRLYNSANLDQSGTNLITNIGQGTTVSGRIGNVIFARYLTLGLTIEAGVSAIDQSGEQINNTTTPGVSQYMKTDFRIVLVRDKQVNNNGNSITWGDVFGVQDNALSGVSFASSEPRSIPNMGRFEILVDKRVTLDGDDPMRSININKWIGRKIRYNGPGFGALADTGYYMLIAQDVLGDGIVGTGVNPGFVRLTSRVEFTDS